MLSVIEWMKRTQWKKHSKIMHSENEWKTKNEIYFTVWKYHLLFIMMRFYFYRHNFSSLCIVLWHKLRRWKERKIPVTNDFVPYLHCRTEKLFRRTNRFRRLVRLSINTADIYWCWEFTLPFFTLLSNSEHFKLFKLNEFLSHLTKLANSFC